MTKRLWLPLPSQEYLHECFDYDRKSGRLTWRSRPRRHYTHEKSWQMHSARMPGRAADSKIRSTDGYRVTNLDNRTYRTARIIFKWMTGREPHHIDHRDGERSNNRWSNLRAATEAQNKANVRARRHSKLGIKGVRVAANGIGFQARISINRKTIHLGCFATAEEAHAAYLAAARAHWGEFASGG